MALALVTLLDEVSGVLPHHFPEVSLAKSLVRQSPPSYMIPTEALVYLLEHEGCLRGPEALQERVGIGSAIEMSIHQDKSGGFFLDEAGFHEVLW